MKVWVLLPLYRWKNSSTRRKSQWADVKVEKSELKICQPNQTKALYFFCYLNCTGIDTGKCILDK